MATTKALLTPGKIGTLEIKNRVMMSPMGSGYGTLDGYMDERLATYLARRAEGGCGIVCMEFTAVSPSGQPPMLPCIYNDSYIPGLTKVATAIKEKGAKAFIQLAHCGRQTFGDPPNGPILAASPLPCMASGSVGREMTEEEIWQTIEDFGDGAVRAIKAGFDGIEVHCAHGYLIQNFLSPYSNKRTDDWGGSFENRSRFAREIMKNIRKKVGPDFPVITRVSGWEPVVENGLTLEDQIKFCKMLEEEGSDCIDVSVGVYGMQHYLIPPTNMPLGLNVDNAVEIKKNVNIPVMVVGRINDPIQAEDLLASGKVDFLCMGRGTIADPDFVNKFAAGEYDDIVKCIGCMEGCFGESLFGRSNLCSRNPAVGKEKEYVLKPTTSPKKILVIGGGPGGLEIAKTLKERGHDVTLCEKGSRLGGNFYLAGLAPKKGEYSDAALQMGRLAERAGVKVQRQTEVTPEFIDAFKPDVVIVATGAVPAIPQIPGVDGANVTDAISVLSGAVSTKQKIVVLGSDKIACSVADFLAANGKDVTMVTPEADINADFDFVRQAQNKASLAEKNVEMITEAECTEIKADSVVYQKDGNAQEITGVDNVVVALGMKSNNALADYVKKAGIECHVIGDASQPGCLINATQVAGKLGREI